MDRLFPRRDGAAAVPTGTPAGPAPSPAEAELLARRDALTRRFTDLQWDLGGLVYEMAIRDHFRLDVLVQHAAQLQEADAQLAEVERLVRLGDAGAGGECPKCGAMHARGAVFCWQCGNQLLQIAPRPA